MARGRGLLRGVSRLQLLVAALLVAAVVGTTAFAGSLVVALMTAVGAIGGGTSLWVLLALLVTVLAAGLAAAGSLAYLAWLALAQLRAAVSSTYRRLLFWAYHRARTFEDASALGTLLRPSRLFAAHSDRDGPLVAELQSRYVAGELDELAFERELERLLGEEFGAPGRRHEAIDVTVPDGGAGEDAEDAGEESVDAAQAGERADEDDSERERA